MSELWHVARQLRWQDIVDIAVLTFVAGRLYIWLRGTLALQVAVGFLTIAIGSWVASNAGLTLTAYVLQAIVAVSILVAVVIFQNEIRRALGRASPLRWWQEKHQPTAGAANPYAPLAEGLFDLARKGIGALVVVPRLDVIDEHLNGGTPVEAVVTRELLESLFHHGSPLHDGAVVVEGDRVRRAGVFLPLSSAPELPQHFGTRHRAALGITEVSDALVVVVSEERREITLAVEGRVAATPSTPGVLARKIDDLVRRAREGRGERSASLPERGHARRRRAVRDGLAHVAIFAGVVAAWYTIAGERDSIMTRTVPVELRGVSSGLDYAPPQPNLVTVHLRGARRLLTSLSPSSLRASIDLGDAKPGENELSIAASAPSGVEVIRVSPPRVQVEVLERRSLPVTAILAAGLPAALRIREVVPSRVEVIGRRTVLRNLDTIKTRAIGKDELSGNTARVELLLRDGLQLADDKQREIVVQFEETARAARP